MRLDDHRAAAWIHLVSIMIDILRTYVFLRLTSFMHQRRFDIGFHVDSFVASDSKGLLRDLDPTDRIETQVVYEARASVQSLGPNPEDTMLTSFQARDLASYILKARVYAQLVDPGCNVALLHQIAPGFC